MEFSNFDLFLKYLYDICVGCVMTIMKWNDAFYLLTVNCLSSKYNVVNLVNVGTEIAMVKCQPIVNLANVGTEVAMVKLTVAQTYKTRQNKRKLKK